VRRGVLPWCRAWSVRQGAGSPATESQQQTHGLSADSLCLSSGMHTGGKQEAVWPEPDLRTAALLSSARQSAAHCELRSMSAGLIQRLSGVMASVPVCRARTRPASSRRSCSRGVLACLARVLRVCPNAGLRKASSSTGGQARADMQGMAYPALMRGARG